MTQWKVRDPGFCLFRHITWNADLPSFTKRQPDSAMDIFFDVQDAEELCGSSRDPKAWKNSRRLPVFRGRSITIPKKHRNKNEVPIEEVVHSQNPQEKVEVFVSSLGAEV